MDSFLFKTLRWLLRQLARLTIWRYQPGVIGITGSVGKTSTKLAIKAVLEKERRVRASVGNLNNDLGLPLAVLGDWKLSDLKLVSRDQPPHTARVRKFFFWAKVMLSSSFRIAFASKSKYPEILILEYGADRPGDLRYLLDIARPSISIITAIGEIPVHVEFFAGPDELAREKARLIEYLPAAGFAVLNYDDETVMELKDKTRAHVMTFGFAKGAEVQVTRFENRAENGRPTGISFKLEHAGSFVPVRVDGVFGKSQAYAAAAAASVGLIFGLNLVKISEALRDYKPADSRMQLVPGVKYTYVIDDAYNASPLSMHAALDVLRSLPAKRKIAVLGDMLEIGKYALEAHERVGRLAAGFVDVLVTVGPRAKFIAEAAREARLRKNNIYSFDTADEASKPVQDLIRKGDLILVKGSHAMEMSKIVEEIKAF
jgi:UDP-N-acetylmuramoyl-tripeptide--D-alanyl-D-alanine ligase